MNADMVEDDWQWLTHPDIAPLSQRFHIGAVGYWTARGWEPCDPPTEHDAAVAERPKSDSDPAPEAEATTASKPRKTGASAPEGSE